MIVTNRPSVDLSGRWAFVRDPERRVSPSHLPDGESIAVPGAWEAQLDRPYGIVHGWYSRRFATPDDWRHGTILLRFGSVMARAKVWSDGRVVGEHEDGYLPFELAVGPAEAGADHELIVLVENLPNILDNYPAFGVQALRTATDRLDGRSFDTIPHGKQTWYTSTSGLLGPVVAELAPDPRLAAVVALPNLAANEVLVRWRLAGSRVSDPATVSLTLTSPSGETVARASAAAGNGEAILDVPNPERWDLWRPAFYRLDLRLEPDVGRRHARDTALVADEATVRFGMRSIAVRDGAILLNGRPIYLRGALDQDFWPIGRANAPSRAALEDQAQRARELGLNLLRCHVKPPDSMYLDVADEIGLLVWCELPSWTRFDISAGRTARRMLGRMVETIGSHPSVVAWTVINEGWGTDLRHSASDRRWLRTTVDWLKTLDPTRLVVDNSACETPHGPGFHLRTDLADFHAYRSMPDGLPRWRSLVADFARRPGWLWSPHGDAAPTGDEALVMSEFGGWGLPRPSTVAPDVAGEPWWWSTGQTFRRPAGIHRRFVRQRLDRIWPDVDALADATQWRQFEALVAHVRELRRFPSIRGYVITELTDAFWEANGLLDANRGRKIYSERVGEVNAPDVLVVDLPRSDLRSGEALTCDVIVSSFPDAPESAIPPRAMDWQLDIDGSVAEAGTLTLNGWPRGDARVVARLEIDVPHVTSVANGELRMVTGGAAGERQAVYRQPLVIVPSLAAGTSLPLRVKAIDPLDLWSIESQIRTIGHELVPLDEADLIVASQVDREVLAAVNAGTPAMVLVRGPEALPAGIGLARSIAVRQRRPGDGTPQHERPWDGDWSSVFAWALPGIVPGLPDGGLLSDAHAEIFPDRVLDGLDVAAASDGVEVGLFSAWVHSPAALLATFPQGSGRLTVTTLRLAPALGPLATALLDSLLRSAGQEDRARRDRPAPARIWSGEQ